jgi:hypothetical protein
MEPTGLHAKLTADPQFLHLTSGYRRSGTVLTRSRLDMLAHTTRCDLTRELMLLSQPDLEPFLLGCPSVMQQAQECVTELARDIDRLVHEVEVFNLPREVLSEKAECLTYQVLLNLSACLTLCYCPCIVLSKKAECLDYQVLLNWA